MHRLAVGIVAAAALATAEANADTWGAYTAYALYSEEESYGAAWNFPSPETAMAKAVETCLER